MRRSPSASTSTNWINAYAFEPAVSTYVPVELGFQNAGLVSLSLLTVPPVGYYAGIAPNPPQGIVPASSAAAASAAPASVAPSASEAGSAAPASVSPSPASS